MPLHEISDEWTPTAENINALQPDQRSFADHGYNGAMAPAASFNNHGHIHPQCFLQKLLNDLSD